MQFTATTQLTANKNGIITGTPSLSGPRPRFRQMGHFSLHILPRSALSRQQVNLRPEATRLNELGSPYESLIRPIETRMMRTIVRIVGNGDDACDVFQDVLATVWARKSRIAAHANPHGYILRICVTRAYDLLRKRARRREVAMPEQVAARAVKDAPQDHVAATVRQALGRLPGKQGKAVLLKLFDDAPYEAIAEALRCSKATARSHVSKGLARLRSDSEFILSLEDQGE